MTDTLTHTTETATDTVDVDPRTVPGHPGDPAVAPTADLPDTAGDATDEVPTHSASASVPRTPLPPPAPPDDGTDGSRPRRGGGKRRFLGGLITGAAVTGLAAAAFVVVDGAGDDAAPTSPPAATTANDTAATGGTSAAVSGMPTSVHDLVTTVRPSIAAIHTTVTQTDVFGRSLAGEAAGTGFVLSEDGYVVTNDHVVEGAEQIKITFDDGEVDDAELVAADPRSDLAVLHVDRDDLVPLAIGDSDAIQVGDPVVAIGNALDLGAEPTVTAGLVSAKDRTITEENGQVLVDLLQTDAAISPGNSGGPLLDTSGHVVGINTAIAGQGQNIGFAIAINPAIELIDQLRAGEVPRHALLGVTTRADTEGNPGAVVASVEAGSAADDAGLRAGDVITALGSDTVDGPEDLVAAIARHRPGDEVDVTIERDGHEQHLTVTLGAHDETSS